MSRFTFGSSHVLFAPAHVGPSYEEIPKTTTGGTYTRWGRLDCGSDAELVYAGMAAGVSQRDGRGSAPLSSFSACRFRQMQLTFVALVFQGAYYEHDGSGMCCVTTRPELSCRAWRATHSVLLLWRHEITLAFVRQGTISSVCPLTLKTREGPTALLISPEASFTG